MKYKIFKALAIVGGVGAILGGVNSYLHMASYVGPPTAIRPATPDVRLLGATAAPPERDARTAIVRMRDLLDAHPLARVLAADDRQLYALALVQNAPRTGVDGAAVAALQTKLQARLRAIADAAQKKLNARAAEFSREERRETASLLAAAARDRAKSNRAAEVVGAADASMSAIALEQRRKFVGGVNAEMRAAVAAAQAGLDVQAKSALEAEAGRLSQAESALAAELAARNGQERINLRLKQANPKIALEERKAVDARIAELNASDNAALFAKRAEDKKRLVDLAADFRAHRAAAATTVAAGDAGRGALRTQDEIAPLPLQTPVSEPASTPAPMDARLHERLLATHRKYQSRFDAEQKASVAAFQAKRADFQAQLRALGGAAEDARAQSAAEVARLREDRARTYGAMVEAIRDAVRRTAAARGMRTVIVDPVATVDAIDLTQDVKRAIATSE